MIRDLIALDDSAKVWIYQADRFLTYEELDEVRPRIFDFLENWTAHQQSLMTYGNVFHRRFLALFVDESIAGASGCSIDKSVHFVESIGSHIGVDFFDRTSFTYMHNDEIFDIKSNQIKLALDQKDISTDTLFFDNLVDSKSKFLKEWLKPLHSSWHFKFVK